MTNTYTIKITLDGSDVKSEAGKVRQIVEAELSKIEVQGVIDFAGLDRLRAQMAEVRKDAGGLGRAMSQGLEGQWAKLEGTLKAIQSQITGIVRAGSSAGMAGLADGMDDVTAALSKMDNRSITAAQDAKQLEARLRGLNEQLGKLGATPVQPLSGARTSTLSELYRGFAEAGSKGNVTRIRNAIENELDTLTTVVRGRTVNLRAEINRAVQENMKLAAKVLEGMPESEVATLQKHFDALGVQVQVSAQGLYKDLDEVNAAIEAHLKLDPGAFSAERAAWEQELNRLVEIQQDIDREITTTRSIQYGGDTEPLIAQLEKRRRELEKEKAKDLTFWKEWSMETPQAVADALRAEGQSAAAGALESMLKIQAEVDRLEAKQKAALAKLTQGGQVELPKGAQGTLVDFVTAERALGEVAGQATTQLTAQQKVLANLVKAFDTAHLAAEGLNEAQRTAVQQAEKAASREMKKGTPARMGLEEAAEVERQVLGRLAQEVASLSQRMETALAEPVTEEAEKQATGLLRLWQWVSDKLVGHSVIPEMVNAINEWLALVGQDAAQQDAAQIAAAEEKARALIRLAESEARAGIEAEKRLTTETVAQTKARQAQKTEAARRVTIRQRGTTTLDVATGKADLKEQERQNKLLGEAQKLAGELGLAWSDIAARMQGSATTLETVIGGLKRLKQEQTAANRAAAQQTKLQTDAQHIAQNLGLSWDQVEAAMQASGVQLGDVARELKRVEAEQQRLTTDARDIAEHYRGFRGSMRLFTDELEKARRAHQGLYAVANDFQQIGNSLRMNAGIVTGAVVVAGRDYVTFAKQSDVAARSLALTADLTQQLRQLTVEQSATLAVLNPEDTARGITVWAQATGQAVDSQAKLNTLLAQTVPIQQAAALSQTDINTLTEATAGALNQYGLGLGDTTHVVAIFNKVADDTLAAVGDVAESFKYVGPTADRAGESIEQTATAFAILGDNGIRGTMAGTAYGRMLENLLVPNSTEAEELFTQMFGTSSPFFDAQGQFIGTARAVDMLAAALSTMSDQEREAAINTIFDTNAARAATVLIRKQTEARAEGINILEQEAAALSGDALAVWEKQVADWEESDVYRVQQAQMRWKAFWLTVGQQGLDLALPALKEAVRLIDTLTATIQANPWMVQAIAVVASGAVVAGTLVTAVGTVSKTVLGVQTLIEAYKSTVLKQETAHARFQSAVVSSAEQFRAIITQAATQAAGTETAGAVEETNIEKAGAMEEAAIEKSSAISIGKILGSALLAATVAEVGSQALTGQSITGWGSTREGQAAAAQRLAGLQDASPEELRGVLVDLKDDLVLLDKYVVKEGEKGPGMLLNPDYWKTVLGAGGEDTERLRELMGGTLRTFSGQAIADKYAEVEATIQGINALLAETGNDYNDVGVQVARMMQELGDASEDLGYQLYQQGAVTKGLASLTEDQKTNIVNIYTEMLQAQADAVSEFQTALSEAERDLQRDLADLARDYEKNRAAEETSFYADAAKAAADYHKQEAEAQAQHQKDMQRMQEDHEARVWDLTLARDAAGLYKENQQYETERQRAEQDFADERAQAAQEFAIEQAERAAQHAQKMAELATQYEEERAQRLADHATQVAELNAEHEEEMARLNKEYFDKLNAESGYYRLSQTQQSLYQNAMLADANAYLQANRAQWQAYVASLPIPQTARGGGYREPTTEYQEGGYVTHTGPALVHAGEYVMSANTARQVEASVGGRLTQQNILGRGGLTVQATFTGMGSNDRAWFERRLGDFSRELAGMLQ